jgi:hypothetical protein
MFSLGCNCPVEPVQILIRARREPLSAIAGSNAAYSAADAEQQLAMHYHLARICRRLAIESCEFCLVYSSTFHHSSSECVGSWTSIDFAGRTAYFERYHWLHVWFHAPGAHRRLEAHMCPCAWTRQHCKFAGLGHMCVKASEPCLATAHGLVAFDWCSVQKCAANQWLVANGKVKA